MEILTIVGIIIGAIAAIFGIPAAIVQVADYYQKRREKVDLTPQKTINNSSRKEPISSGISRKSSQISNSTNSVPLTKLLAQAMQLTSNALNRFESNHVYPEDCEKVYAEMKLVWDDHLVKAHGILDKTKKPSDKVSQLRENSRLLFVSLYSDIRDIMQEVMEFRGICLEDKPATAKTRLGIRDHIADVRSKINKILSGLT